MIHLFMIKIVRFIKSKLYILVQWEPENYGIGRQHYGVLVVVNQLFS